MPGLPDLASFAPTIAAAEPDRCREVLALLGEGLRILDPEAAVARALAENRPPGQNLTVVAVGKASPAMARGAAAALGDTARRWLVISDHGEAVPAGAELVVTSHPLPDRSSWDAGRRLLRMVAEPADHVVFLVSGGGSSLAEVPVATLSLDDVRQVYELLMREGVPIDEANVVRSHLSAIKGGKLAAAASAPITTIVLSDVGPRLELVASGPSLPCPAPPAEALAVLARRRLTDRMPAAAISVLESALPGPPPPAGNVIATGDGAAAAEGAAQAGSRMGLPVSVVTTDLEGEAADTARWALRAVMEGEIGLMAGETTVTVRGQGEGGRNQEAALVAALMTEGSSQVFVALGTDGIDGPTDAAGAYVDGLTVERIRRAGMDPLGALADNDSHHALDGGGALIRTGPTGINVADLWLVDRR